MVSPGAIEVGVSGPLAGVKVLDFTWNLPGPYATARLVSLGATVWKVEPPRGDPAREVGALFDWLNQGKQSVVLDLKTEAGQRAMEALVGAADVLVEGFRPGVMQRLGCGPDRAHALNPGLVWCSISAFGQEGPARGVPGHDLNLQALSGLCHLERDRRGRPRPTVLPVADLSAAMAAVSAVLAALLARQQTGEGAVLDVSMADAITHWTDTWAHGANLLADLEAGGAAGAAVAGTRWFREIDRLRLYALPHYGLFRCVDGRWLAIGIVDEGRFWRALCKALGLRGMSRLPMPARVALGPALRRVVALRLAMRTQRHWLDVLGAADVPVTPVLSPSQAQQDPWLARRDLRTLGPIPGSVPAGGPAPALGEHTDQVLASVV